jgi:iduronate 2-sulfatase
MSDFPRAVRISTFAVVFIAAAGAYPLAAQDDLANRTKPNVLFICVDDLKPISGCYGGTAKTPHLDRLARRGVLFERAYCNQAVCAPSRNALLTGLRPQTVGIYDLGTNFRKATPGAITLPQYFKQHGWRTEGLGKIFHVGHGNHEDPASWSVPHWRANVIAYALPESRAKQGLTREEALFSNQPAANLPRGAAYEAAEVPDNAYPDGAMADEVVKRLAAFENKPDEPFFLAAGFVKPHLPFCAPKKYWDLYDRDRFELAELRTPPVGAPRFAPTAWGELRQYRDMPESGPLTAEQERTLIHGYHAAVSFMDAQLGRVLDALEETGLAKNTIIVLWGDHGWHLGDHGMWCKHTNYEQAARIPLIVVAPGAKGGARSSDLVESVDIYPTLCELAGLPTPKDLDGVSFVETLMEPETRVKQAALHVYPRGQRIGRAVRTDRHRLVEWKVPGAPAESADIELYDYEADPGETKNLAADEPKTVAQLRAILAKQPEARPQIARAQQNAKGKAKRRGAGAKRRDSQKKESKKENDQPSAANAVDRFGLFEAAFQDTGEYDNPYRDVEANAELRRPDGSTWSMPLFWDGDDHWKLRFSPDAAGEWSYAVHSRDEGLNGKSGSFVCQPSRRRGSIEPMRDSPGHFQYQNGERMWFLGDTAWALLTDKKEEKHDRPAAEEYLRERTGQGFNVVHSMMLSEAGWGNAGGLPFDDIGDEELNADYWKELDSRVAYANRQGIVVGLAIAWGDKGRQEPFAWRRFADLEARKRYAHYIAARYSAYDVYFIVSGEWHAEVNTRRSTGEAIKREFFEIGDALAAADPHDRMMAIHPMTSHGSVREFNDAAWMSFGDYQQNYRDLHARVLESRETGKPVVNSEYGYYLRDQSGDGQPDKDNSTSLAAMRHASWDIVMAGGYLVTGFGTTYFGGNRDPGPFDLHAEKNDAWEEQIGLLKRLFTDLEWWKLAPHDELLSCETPRGKDRKELGQVAPPTTTYWCLAEPGRQYVVYLRGLKAPVSLKIEGSSKGWSMEQINPRTGERHKLKANDEDGSFRYTPPDEEDWVVLLMM